MKLLPGWEARLTAPRAPVQVSMPIAPLDAVRASSQVHQVHDTQQATSLLNLLSSAGLGAVAIRSLCRHEDEPVRLRSGDEWHDIRSLRPICVSLAAWLPGDGNEGLIVRAILDVREPGVAAVLADLLRLRATWVMHDAKRELFALWALGLEPLLPSIFDTHLAAACLHLGRHERHVDHGDDVVARIAGDARWRHEHERLLSLQGQCEHYGLSQPFAGGEDRIRRHLSQLGDALSPAARIRGNMAVSRRPVITAARDRRGP